MTEPNERCAICLEDFQGRVYVPLIDRENSCGHKFHLHCLKTATKAAASRVFRLNWPTCPLCRQKMFWFYPVRAGMFYELNYHRLLCGQPVLKFKKKRICPGVDEHFRPIRPVPRHAMGLGEPIPPAAPARVRIVAAARSRLRVQPGARMRTRSQVAAEARAQAQVEAEQGAGLEFAAEAGVHQQVAPAAQPAAARADVLPEVAPVPEALAPANDVNMANVDVRRENVDWQAMFMAAAVAVPAAIIGHTIFPF